MKLLLAVLLVASFALEGDAQFFGRRFPFGRFGRFGRFGMMGRFGMGGLGFPMPMPVPVPVPVVVPVPHPIIGKRSELTVPIETESVCEIKKIFEKVPVLDCIGSEQTCECELERTFGLDTLELEGLRILPMNSTEGVERLEKAGLYSINQEENTFNDWTFNHGEKIFFSIFHNSTFEDKGFRIMKSECWEKFEKFITTEKQVELTIKF